MGDNVCKKEKYMLYSYEGIYQIASYCLNYCDAMERSTREEKGKLAQI